MFQIDLFLQITDITPGRSATLLPAVLGLISSIFGWLALTRTSAKSYGRLLAMFAFVSGLTGIILSGQHLEQATGNFGTGSGRLGAIVALGVSLIGIVLGGLALARFRRIAKGSNKEGS